MENLFTSLNNSIQGEVLTDKYSLGMYATDASIYQIKPLAIVIPKNAVDVKSALKIAYENI
jgi:FAD/FMN-containing dehydrogenase